ncbi:MAG: hypothetical protein WCV90_08925 [Candidatus Woesearchaeota archaeon]|jgi:hypothetical protein
MVLKGKTSVQEHGNGKALYLPVDLLKDSAFPFTLKDVSDLVIEIRGKELIIRLRGKNEEL